MLHLAAQAGPEGTRLHVECAIAAQESISQQNIEDPKQVAGLLHQEMETAKEAAQKEAAAKVRAGLAEVQRQAAAINVDQMQEEQRQMEAQNITSAETSDSAQQEELQVPPTQPLDNDTQDTLKQEALAAFVSLE